MKNYHVRNLSATTVRLCGRFSLLFSTSVLTSRPIDLPNLFPFSVPILAILNIYVTEKVNAILCHTHRTLLTYIHLLSYLREDDCRKFHFYRQ